MQTRKSGIDLAIGNDLKNEIVPMIENYLAEGRPERKKYINDMKNHIKVIETRYNSLIEEREFYDLMKAAER